MRKTNSFAIGFIAVFALLFLSCASVTEDTPSIDESELIGTWHGDDLFNDTIAEPKNATVHIKADRTFELTSNVLEDVVGTWTLNGSSIIVSNLPNNEPDRVFGLSLQGDQLVVVAEGFPIVLYRQ